MSRPPWEDCEPTRRDRHEQKRYENTRCSECGEKCCPPEMDVCPFCRPDTDYEKDDSLAKEGERGQGQRSIGAENAVRRKRRRTEGDR